MRSVVVKVPPAACLVACEDNRMDRTRGPQGADTGGRSDDPAPSRGRSGFDAFLTSGVILALGLFSTVAVARGLGPAGKGRFDLLVATGSIAGLLFGLQLPIGITYVVARRGGAPRDLRRRMAAFAAMQGAATAIALWILWIIFSSDSARGDVPVAVTGALIVLFVVGSAVASLWRGIVVGRQEIIRANRRDLAIRLVQVGLVVAIVVVGSLADKTVPADLVFAGTTLAALMGAAVYVWAARPNVALAKGDGKEFREAATFAVPAYAANLVQMANYRLDLYFVAFFVGAARVGVYMVAVVLAQLVWLAPQAVAMVLLPSTASDQADVKRHAARATLGARLSLWGGVALALVLVVTGPWLIPLIFGSSFGGSARLLFILIPGVVLFSPATVFASFVAGMGRPRLNLVVSCIGFVVTIGLDLLLIPDHGAAGAAIASTASYSMSALAMAVIFRRLSSTRWSEIVGLRMTDLRGAMRAARSAIARREPAA